MIYVNDKIQEVSEDALNELITTLPSWRREQVLRFNHLDGRREGTLAYLLLCEALRKEFGIEEMPTFVYDANGKPHLKEFPKIHFNLSHCRKAVACAVNLQPVGIDIETLGRYKESLARYTMNKDELDEIQKAESPDLAFTRLWTMKEATQKLSGEGISTNVRQVLHSSNIIYNTREDLEIGYVVTLAQYNKE